MTLSHHNILNNAYFTARNLALGEDDRVCVPVPFSHWFGLVVGDLACATHGACVVVPGESFEPGRRARDRGARRLHLLYGVPTMFIACSRSPIFERFDLSSVRTGVMGGAPCPVEVLKSVREQIELDELTIVGGMTETSPVSTQTPLDESRRAAGRDGGHVHPHVELKMVDPSTGKIVPRGTPGELCTRGYSVMLGYWEDELATNIAIDSAGWLHTGDLALMNDERPLSASSAASTTSSSAVARRCTRARSRSSCTACPSRRRPRDRRAECLATARP